MIGRLRNNQSLTRKKGYFHTKEAYLKIASREKVIFKSASPEQLSMIRNKIRLQRKIAFTRFIVAFAVSVVLGLLVCYTVIYLWQVYLFK